MAVKEFLAAALADQVTGPAPTVGVGLPSAWKLTSPSAVVVFDDGGQTRWPIAVRPTLRVTVWAAGRTRAREVAGAALGLLLARAVPGIATIAEPSQVLDARDKETGGLLASFTVKVQSRTLPA